MPTSFTQLPAAATLKVSPFTVAIPDSEITDLKTLVTLGKIGPATYENGLKDGSFGVSREWILAAKEEWAGKFDWRQHEARMNRFPQCTAEVSTGFEQETIPIHFVALFSDSPTAVPLLLVHGWPGSFLEFLPILEILTSKHTSASLPYHLIVPSLPGYGFSGPPPLNRDFRLENVATVLNNLMVGLGFASGYVAQGGDLGSFLSRYLAVQHESCKAAHVNLCNLRQPQGFDISTLMPAELQSLQEDAKFHASGSAYGFEHATRPSTIGFVLSSNPIALLAWIGEKYLEWTDESPPIDEILVLISLYWFTNTISTTLYPYRQIFHPSQTAAFHQPNLYIKKPFGFSAFPKEIAKAPKSWVATTGHLVFFRQHDRGGHFAAMEVPEVLLKDIEDFVELVWK